MFLNEDGKELIPIRKEDLLKAVKDNRDVHQRTYKEAIHGYRQEVIEKLSEYLADAKGGREIKTHVNLIEPTNHTAEYDRVLKALEMTTLTEISLTGTQFACWVMDDWQWKHHFNAATMNYVGAGKSGSR